MAQNSKTIRIIFLPKCTKKTMLLCFFTRFSAYFGTIWQNKIDFSDDIHRIFSHKPTLVDIPLFNSAKNHTKDGHQSLARKVLEILIPIVSLFIFIFMLIFSQICDILVSFWMHGYGSNL